VEHWHGVAALALYQDQDDVRCNEFGLLVRLGFFVAVGRRYRMEIPETVTLAAVKRAALEMVATAEVEDDGTEVFWPERLMQVLTKEEAEAERSTMMAMRRFRMITG